MSSARLAYYCIVGLLSVTAVAAGQQPLDVGCGKQLFIGPWTEDGRDEYLVGSMKNVTMTMHEARVTGERLMVQDKPWEMVIHDKSSKRLDVCYVIKDGDLFRMYYNGTCEDPNFEPYRGVICYAESKDGLHWDKPNLGLWEWKGSRANNIVFPNDDFKRGPSVPNMLCAFIDPNAKSPDEKYKLYLGIEPAKVKKGTERPKGWGKSLPKGKYGFTSGDGIHWKLITDKRVPLRAGDGLFDVFWDERIKEYVGYSKIKFIHRPHKVYEELFGVRWVLQDRKIARNTSKDLVNWTPEVEVLAPDEIDNAHMPKGMMRLDYYFANVSKYNEAPDIYLAIPKTYYHWTVKKNKLQDLTLPVGHWPGTIDIQLMTSRDGISWQRAPERRPFIRLGLQGTFWSRWIFPCPNVIRVGDELWIYFVGMDIPHIKLGEKQLKADSALTRAVLRLDGFISARAAYTGGELTTKPMTFEGGKLQLNVDTSAGGSVRVEIQDEAGQPIESFNAVDADEINGNYIRVLASWKDNPDVSSLAGKPIRLRFVMRDCDLYSFQFLP